MLFDRDPQGKLRKAAVTLWAIGPLVGVVVAIAIGFTWLGFGVFMTTYLLGGFGVTVGFHRHFAHPSFRCKQPIRLILAILGTSAGEGEILEWSAQHRKHHKFTDQEDDPHSPHAYGSGVVNILRGLWHAHIGWIIEGDNTPDHERYASDLLADSMVVMVSRLWWVIVLVRLALPFGIGYAIAGLSGGITAFFWGVAGWFVTLHSTFAVNSICHIWGTRPFRNKATGLSTNCILLAPITLGEAFHCTHHAFPDSAHHGMTKFERALDPSWWIIWTLGKHRLAWDIKEPTPERLARFRNPDYTPSAVAKLLEKIA
jgi:stearoyl-CoA desaturase (delta-9 desaturase)